MTPPPENMLKGSEYVLITLENVTFFRSKLLLAFHVIEDGRLLSKTEGKTNFSRRLKQFDGLIRLNLTTVFYDKSTPLQAGTVHLSKLGSFVRNV